MEVVTVPGLQRTADWLCASFAGQWPRCAAPAMRAQTSIHQTNNDGVRKNMSSLTRLGLRCSVALAVSTADAAPLTGTVKGPDGQPFRGAFVQARNAKTKITVNVLSDN